jgi:two-component system cell cycle response regulator
MINVSFYFIRSYYATQLVDIVLQQQLSSLTTHYKVLLETQNKTSVAIYKLTIQMDRVIELMSEASHSSAEKKAELREEFHALLAPKYKIFKEEGVLQYHFVLPTNESFYRAHKVSKFGDDLTGVRTDFEYTNRTKKPIQGFTQGRTSHAFRNIFPLFDKNTNYIGAIEISFSSDSLQWYLNHISGIHSHFLVDKKIFDTKAWKRDDLVLNYTQSTEHKNYLLNLGDIHTKEICIDENSKKLAPIREEIDSKILLEKGFSTYVKHHNHVDAMAFLPIHNIDDQVVAWIVSYEESPIINTTLSNTSKVRIIIFLLSLLIIYLIVKQIYVKQELEKQHSLLRDILNTTDNPMVLTDFKDIKMSNEAFRKLLDIQNRNFLNIFASTDGYLHSGLLKENETFLSLILRTEPKDRIVSILDKHFELKIFKISIIKTKENSDYLVTLSDITKMKEQQVITEKKAYIDGLTEVYNRNKFDEIFEEELKSVKRYKVPLSMAMLDIDKFKDFNDKYGHLIGDEVLIMMAQAVNKNVRDTDVFARWGGEEFVILFKNTSVNVAKEVAQKLKDKIEENQHQIAGKITASFGVTEYKDGDTLESIFKRCDDALYKAKEKGRNRVEVL